MALQLINAHHETNVLKTIYSKFLLEIKLRSCSSQPECARHSKKLLYKALLLEIARAGSKYTSGPDVRDIIVWVTLKKFTENLTACQKLKPDLKCPRKLPGGV